MSLDASKLNVTSRDYKSIFTDLTNVIPDLTTQWVTNDESDPGIVLVKLMSMLGDMLSYNTDKAYLEAYPDTVTQRKNAYQIFKLIGYKMKWYRSATCDCYFNNSGETSSVITIPRYSKITSKDNRVCYTNPDEVIYVREGIDGEVDQRQHTDLIEGIPITPDLYVDTTYTNDNSTYVFNNNESWHAAYKYNVNSNIITDNRIYFGYSNVDQDNITLIDDQDEEWLLVDNIDTALSADTETTSKTKLFEFDIDEFDRPYIKLVDYWSDIGITKFKLFYIVSSGSEGKISDNILYNISSELYRLINPANPRVIIRHYASTEGYDPETPKEAREQAVNYINTFDTLVTLDDFTKFIKRDDYVANAIAKDLTNDFNKYPVIAFSSIKNLVNKFADETITIDPFYTYSIDSTTHKHTRGSAISPAPTGISAEIHTAVLNAIKSGTTATTTEINASEDLYEAICLYNKLLRSQTLTNTENQILNSIEYYYYTDYTRVYTDDMLYFYNTYKSSVITSRTVNVYITPETSYSEDDYESDHKDTIESDLEGTKMIPLNVETTTNGINYYSWEISGTVYLKNPVSYAKAQGILVSIDNNLRKLYSYENMSYNAPIKNIELVNNIIDSDSSIYYVDLDKIEYSRYDKITTNMIGSSTTDKTVISGEKYLQNLDYIKDASTGTNTFFSTLNGTTHFEMDFLGTYYKSGEEYDILDYNDQDLKQGNILVKPGSFSIVLEGGSYIIKDNGYGSLVCNENILKSSEINYKISDDGTMKVSFDLFPEISISSIGTINIKYAHNKLSMISFSGLNPNAFTIDSESIET